jgi:hypothetical protein
MNPVFLPESPVRCLAVSDGQGLDAFGPAELSPPFPEKVY